MIMIKCENTEKSPMRIIYLQIFLGEKKMSPSSTKYVDKEHSPTKNKPLANAFLGAL